MATKRLNDIDIAKGIGITLVVLGHTWRDNISKKAIYFFHLPLFFILSGFFFNIKKYSNYWQFLKDNARSLILPFITFYLLGYIYFLLIERHIRPGDENTPVLTPLLGFIHNDYMGPNGAVWFLMALFVSKNFLYLAVRFVKSKILFIGVLILSAVIGYYLSVIGFYRLPFSINSSFVAFFFLGVGYLAKPYYDYLKDGPIAYRIGIIVVSAIVSSAAIKYNILPDMFACIYGNMFLFLGGAIAGTILCLFISKALGNVSVLEYLGRNSLIIMGISEPIKRAVIGVFSKFTHYPVNVIRLSLGLSFACAVITLLVLVPFIYVFTNYLYFAIGMSKKKKDPYLTLA